MSNLDGVIDTTSASQSGVVEPTSAVSADPNVAASADPSNAQQGGVQGANGATQTDDVERRIQAEADKRMSKFLGEKYQLEQQVNQLRDMQMQMMQSQIKPQTNPYDPTTQPEQYWDWKMSQMAETAAQKAQKAYEQTLTQTLSQLQEQQWIASHPNVDVQGLKYFNRMNGIPENNLEVGYKLMNYENNLLGVARNASQQTLNNFRQPQGAQPIRGQSGAGSPEASYDFNTMLKEAAVNPDALNKYPEKDRNEFWAVVNRMKASGFSPI